jgi:hypothetical protein
MIDKASGTKLPILVRSPQPAGPPKRIRQGIRQVYLAKLRHRSAATVSECLPHADAEPADRRSVSHFDSRERCWRVSIADLHILNERAIWHQKSTGCAYG